MSITAQKQDISDPDVIHAFAQLVGERERLDYLYLLTCADIAGTSPKLWNGWKDRLLADLYFATDGVCGRAWNGTTTASSGSPKHVRPRAR